MNTRCSFFFVVLCTFFATSAQAERDIIVRFSTATLTINDSQHGPLLETLVVLPKSNLYALPVSGTVSKAEIGPAWTPTPQMHRRHPSKYKGYYAPFAKGNAMGHCKVTIDFDKITSALDGVRIHGYAKENDLGKRLSAGCIRIPDDLCVTLVAFSQGNEPVRVRFEP